MLADITAADVAKGGHIDLHEAEGLFKRLRTRNPAKVAAFALRAAIEFEWCSMGVVDFLLGHAEEAERSELLVFFATYEQFGARRAVAVRDDLPPDLVAKLAADEHYDVRCAIAYRRDLPPELVATLAADPDGYVRRAVKCGR